jgi:hypothetical protein
MTRDHDAAPEHEEQRDERRTHIHQSQPLSKPTAHAAADVGTGTILDVIIMVWIGVNDIVYPWR